MVSVYEGASAAVDEHALYEAVVATVCLLCAVATRMLFVVACSWPHAGSLWGRAAGHAYDLYGGVAAGHACALHTVYMGACSSCICCVHGGVQVAPTETQMLVSGPGTSIIHGMGVNRLYGEFETCFAPPSTLAACVQNISHIAIVGAILKPPHSAIFIMCD